MGKSLNQSIRDYLEQLAGGAHREQQWLQALRLFVPVLIYTKRAFFSFIDAIVVASAQAAGCSVGWTEDMNAGEVINNARISNPFACVRLS